MLPKQVAESQDGVLIGDPTLLRSITTSRRIVAPRSEPTPMTGSLRLERCCIWLIRSMVRNGDGRRATLLPGVSEGRIEQVNEGRPDNDRIFFAEEDLPAGLRLGGGLLVGSEPELIAIH